MFTIFSSESSLALSLLKASSSFLEELGLFVFGLWGPGEIWFPRGVIGGLKDGSLEEVENATSGLSEEGELGIPT